MSKEDKSDLTFDAVVVGIEKTYYELELQGVEALKGKIIRGKLSGKMRMYKIRVIIGDKVTVELDPYTPGTGRITYRYK